MKLKVCGMKYNTEEVARLEPDFLGFIFWEPSARFFNQAMADVSNDIKKVGVFVDAAYQQDDGDRLGADDVQRDHSIYDSRAPERPKQTQ